MYFFYLKTKDRMFFLEKIDGVLSGQTLERRRDDHRTHLNCPSAEIAELSEEAPLPARRPSYICAEC